MGDLLYLSMAGKHRPVRSLQLHLGSILYLAAI